MLLTIYHGSEKIIEQPVYGQGKTYNDYGLGFYCTSYLELAKEWACSMERDGYANCYTLDDSDLRTINLSGPDYNILNWMAVLLMNRKPVLTAPLAKRGLHYLQENWLPDIKDADIIRGYRADDSYFSFARAFLTNQITLEQLAIVMKLGNLGEQIVLKSEKAFDRLKFVGYETADASLYFQKRTVRDHDARNEFQRIVEEESKGTYMSDILEGRFDEKSL